MPFVLLLASLANAIIGIRSASGKGHDVTQGRLGYWPAGGLLATRSATSNGQRDERPVVGHPHSSIIPLKKKKVFFKVEDVSSTFSIDIQNDRAWSDIPSVVIYACHLRGQKQKPSNHRRTVVSML